jgi:hypothetical protein
LARAPWEKKAQDATVLKITAAGVRALFVAAFHLSTRSKPLPRIVCAVDNDDE